MSIAANLESWHMPHQVGATLVGPKVSAKSSSFCLHVPVLMPMIGGSKTKTSKGLSKSCFCNDSKCKPSVGSTIGIQNYLTIPRYDNDELKYTLVDPGASFIVEAQNGDPDKLFVTNKVDQSYIP